MGYPGSCGRCGTRREVSGTHQAAFCAVSLSPLVHYLGEVGWVDPYALAEELADRVEDAWCESRMGWGQRVRAAYEVLPRG